MTILSARHRQILVDVALRYRRIGMVAVQLVLVVVSSYLAFALRFDGSIPRKEFGIWADRASLPGARFSSVEGPGR